MMTMTAFDVAIVDHRQRTERAERLGWMVQAASDATTEQPPRQGRSARLSALAAFVSAVLAIAGVR